MRDEQAMLDLIINTAREDDRIRAVIMNGSRANPNAPRDLFQDFDIVYLVTEVAPFKNNLEWIKRFGEIMILQLPEDMGDPPGRDDGSCVYLMQFTDGNRIDLSLFPIARLADLGRASLSVLLLDKDGLIAPFPLANDGDYRPKPPTAKAFADCCNEFWWVCTYVAKGLWREEIMYAKYMLDVVVREQLMKMLRWHIGVRTQFVCDPGKLGKYFRRYLEPDLWALLEGTYADAGYDHTWEALFTMGTLFRTIAVPLAEHFGFEYPHDDDRRVSAHLAHVKHLPRTATEIY
ncbi:MAG: aminoglycoside 6-adenylyltransferase [Thermoflexales bacterium]|nr:aminoglycoside 6-adenylyltransferase [Thermoflexales bacterium]